MKVVIKGWIHRYQGACDSAPLWMFFNWKSSNEITIPVREYELEVEVPDSDMIAEQVQALEEAIQVKRTKFHASIQELVDRKNKLLSLTNDTSKAGLVDDDLPA